MSTCTAGFAAKQVGGLYGILTAGHCRDYKVMHGVHLPFVVGGQGPRADAQFHRIPFGSPHRITNDYICGANADTVCEVTGTRERIDMMGDYVCHTGEISGVSCGEVTDININPTEWYIDRANACRDEDGNGTACKSVFVMAGGPNMKVCFGDSGGPIYDASGIAYGLVNAGKGPCGYGGRRIIFSAVNEIEDYLNVRVLTKPITAPRAPQNLEGRLQIDTAGLELTWQSVNEAMQYLVYRRISGSGHEFEHIGTTRLPRYVDDHGGYSTGQRQQYIVRAATNVKVSEPSNDFHVNVMTTRDIRALLSSDGKQVEISWKSTLSDGNANDQLFEVYRRKVGQGTVYSSIGREKCCSAHDSISGLFPAEYVYRVKPVNSHDLMGSWGSSSNYATVRIPVARPHARPAFDGTLRNSGHPFRGVVISWDKLSSDKIQDQVAYFAVYRRVAVAGQPYTWIGYVRADQNIYYDPLAWLIPGMEYYYRMRIYTYSDPEWWTESPLYASVQVPALPDLQASVNPDSTMVTVSWAEPAGDVARYEVYRRAAIQGESYTRIGQTETVSYSDPFTGLVPGVEYYYRVKAVGASGLAGSWGTGSNYARVVAPAVGGLEAMVVSGGVSVSWAEPAGDVARYEVYRRAAIQGESYTRIGQTETVSYSDPFTGLVPGVEYYYRVKAVGASGLAGSWGTGSNYARVVAPAVGGLEAMVVSGGVSVSWAEPAGDVARYEVYRRAAVQGQPYTKIGESTVASYLDRSTGLTPGTEYYFRVKAVGASGLVGSWGTGSNYAIIKYH